MKTPFPKKESHVPKWFVIDAENQTLGRLSTEVSKLLRGKEISFFTPGVDQGNYVVILNANKIKVSGNKFLEKLYYRNSQRPGSLKIETFKQLQNRIPSRIIEEAVWGMLPKGALGRQYYRRLFIYSDNKINYLKKGKDGKSTSSISLNEVSSNNWIQVNL
jgi:large subunit ribosomal protein L13